MSAVRLVLAGAAIGNGNKGVDALGYSICDAVARDAPGSQLTVLDDGWGLRPDASGRYSSALVEYAGVRVSRRWHRPESWAQIRLAQRLARSRNPVARRLADSDAVLDLSAGDSFTDLYGPVRLRTVTAPKEAALRAGRPLVLLPQTYGPFSTTYGRHLAERLVRAAAIAYSRDARSHEVLLDLAGPDADPASLRPGVDVAFALQSRRPEHVVVRAIEALESDITVGVNVSGLLLGSAARERFGLLGDYLDTMVAVVRALIARGAAVLLVPHVHVAEGRGESDVLAIRAVLDRLRPAERSRTLLVPPVLDAAQVKWTIATCDWFVGSRMHSTIAALSTFTPAAAFAYSGKTIGVFESCGVGEEVVDARQVSGVEAVQRLVESFERRARTLEVLHRQMPSTVAKSREQLREVLEATAAWRRHETLEARR